MAVVGGGGGRSIAGLSQSGGSTLGERSRGARSTSGVVAVDERTPLMAGVGGVGVGVGIAGESSTGVGGARVTGGIV